MSPPGRWSELLEEARQVAWPRGSTSRPVGWGEGRCRLERSGREPLKFREDGIGV